MTIQCEYTIWNIPNDSQGNMNSAKLIVSESCGFPMGAGRRRNAAPLLDVASGLFLQSEKAGRKRVEARELT